MLAWIFTRLYRMFSFFSSISLFTWLEERKSLTLSDYSDYGDYYGGFLLFLLS